MKILIFTTQFYIPSGAEKLSIQLVKELLNQGHEVELLSMYGNLAKEVKEAELELNALGINNIHYLDLPVNPSLRDIISGIFKFRKLLKVHEYEIIETSLIGPMIISAWASYMLPVINLAGIHAVYTKAMHNTKKQLLWRFTVRFNKKLRLYAISCAVADAWSQYASIPRSRIKVIYNGIEEVFFKASNEASSIKNELKLPQEAKLILFVGNIVMYKGVDTLIESVGSILQDVNAYVILIGLEGKAESFFPVKQERYQEFYQNITESSWSNRVKFIGLRNDVARFMASSDILVHPARTEGFGLVIAEALAAGLPVVASNVGGIPEILDGTDSLMISPDKPIEFREAVINVLSLERDKRMEMVKKGKQKALKYSMKERAKSLVNFAMES